MCICMCIMGYMHMQKAVRWNKNYNNILPISLLCSTLLVLGKVPCGMAVVS